MLRIGAIDCDEFSKICEKEKISQFPSYRIYPPFPAPIQDHVAIEKELDSDVIKKMALKHIGNRAIDITA